jgi:hypothetical protein
MMTALVTGVVLLACVVAVVLGVALLLAKAGEAIGRWL